MGWGKWNGTDLIELIKWHKKDTISTYGVQRRLSGHFLLRSLFRFLLAVLLCFALCVYVCGLFSM